MFQVLFQAKDLLKHQNFSIYKQSLLNANELNRVSLFVGLEHPVGYLVLVVGRSSVQRNDDGVIISGVLEKLLFLVTLDIELEPALLSGYFLLETFLKLLHVSFRQLWTYEEVLGNTICIADLSRAEVNCDLAFF